MISNTTFHCGRHAQRLVNPAEVIVHRVNRHHVFVILNFLAERICQASEAAICHAER